MPKFRVCMKGEAPPEEKVIEAKDATQARLLFREELYSWADQVHLETDCEETDERS